MRRLLRAMTAGAVLGIAFAAAVVLPAEAGPRPPSDIQKFTGSVSVSAPATVNFTTMANENQVILSFESRSGGERTLRVYDSSNVMVQTIVVPSGYTSVWSHSITVNPSSAYRVVISVSSGSTRYTLWVNHCPNGRCFD